ncbi:MAG: T9SS type A sorting domain-containing protein [Bacteroidales bacterium]|nr:T9SS type A sorting domain-containing protein [Bacteroidales bacterium]
MKKLPLFLLIALTSLGLFAQVEITDDFNSYTEGTFNGQGGWKAVKHSAGGGVLKIEYVGGDGTTTPDETLGVFFDAANTNYGEIATHKATNGWNFDFSQGGTIEIEIDMYRNYWGTVFGVGYDADGDGSVLPPMSYETTKPNPNLPTQDGGIWFTTTYNNTNDDRFINGIVLPDNTLAVDYDYDYDGWMRWKMMIDLEANNGQGSVSMFIDPECSGEFQPVPEIQGVNCGLTPGSGDRFDPAMWDGVFFLNSSHAGYDNFVLRTIPAGLASQFIDFQAISDQLTSAAPIQLNATASSGLPVSFEVVSGPASVNGNTLTLNGTSGVVKVKAVQEGDANWQPAPSVTRTFEVVDPDAYTPEITIRRPYEGTMVYAPTLNDPVLLVLSAYIEHGDAIKFEDVKCTINGEELQLETAYPDDPSNGYWYTTWIPTAYGSFDMTASITQSGGKTTTANNSFTVTNEFNNIEVTAFNGDLVVTPNQQTNTAEYVFPSHVNAFNDIRLNYQHQCVGGCDPYDRVGYCRVKNYRGEWVELFRYIAPFGVECDADLDVTDYTTVLQGLVEFELYFQTWNGNGYAPIATFSYTKGTPEYKYVDMNELWFGIYDFGDYANQQPVPEINYTFPEGTQKAHLKVITTGHNWSSGTNGAYNTDNAAEFSNNTHHVFVNGTKKYDQHNWLTCNPNPYGCQPQNGTWTYERSGWCPGSMGMVWDFDLSEYVGNGNANIFYQLDPTYIDQCHPNYPDCVNGQNNCPNCSAADNPILRLSGAVVSYSNSIAVIDDVPTLIDHSDSFDVSMKPNPAKSTLRLSTNYDKGRICCHILNMQGQEVRNFVFEGETTIDIEDLPSGVYMVNFIGGQLVTRKFVKE